MKPQVLQRVLAAAFGVIAGVLLGGIILLGRNTVLYGSMLFSSNPYVPRFMDKAYLVVFGVVWLVGWFMMYWHLSDGVRYNNLRTRAMRITGILLVGLFFASAPGFYFSEGGAQLPLLGLVTVGLAVGVLLIRAAQKMQANPARISG